MTTSDVAVDFGGFRALGAVRFDTNQQVVTGIIGPNGAGKTTLTSMLCTILRPTSGTGLVWNHDIRTEQDAVRKSIGVVFQDPSLDDELTGSENLWFHGRLYKVPADTMEKRAEELLELMELSDRADDQVKTYSGGMRRRLEIARGLLHHPKVLFLDEPTLGLDPQTRRHIWKYIERLNKEEGVTMMLTTHYMEEADYLCDRIAIMDLGKIVTLGTPSDLKSSLGGDVVTFITQFQNENLKKNLLQISDVKGVDFVKDAVRLTAAKGESVIPQALEVMRKLGVEVRSVTLQEPTLEDVFIKYTGRRLRDESEGKKAQLKRTIGHRRRMRH
ncbi:MAG: ATP-binding cassette domain-containing protein [Thermoplasmata archaeon]|nr:MAG: ATP-binding cassette domain-containing protein [Thermoplasmata archaeon]